MVIVNLSRLGKAGTGMWQYSLKFIKAVAVLGALDGIICAKSHKDKFINFGCTVITVPDCVSNTSKVSRFRPMLWAAYSYFLAIKLWLFYRQQVVVSTTHHGLPLLHNQIITIHDLRPYYHPDSVMQKVYFHYFLPRILKRCKQVLTVSQTVRSTIADCYNYAIEHVHVIYNSVDHNEFSSSAQKEPFLLAVGASWRHKNIHKLIEAAETWCDNYRLVIVSGKTGYAEQLKQRVLALGLEDSVEFRHEVVFTELKALYASASALIYPSIDEGFGIPPIEAMLSGTPVIVSNLPVFHEVLGDAVLYVEPDMLSSWQAAFTSLSESSIMYIERGYQRAAMYNENNMKKMVKAWLDTAK